MTQLQRRVGFWGGILMVFSMIVGSGFLGVPGIMVEQAGPLGSLAGWLLIIPLAAPMVHIFARLGTRFPSADGAVAYAEFAFGPRAASGFSFVVLGAFMAGMPAFFFIGGAYMAELLQLNPDRYAWVFAVLLGVFSTALNTKGTDKLGWLSAFVVPLLLTLMVVGMAWYLPQNLDGFAALHTLAQTESLSWHSVWTAAVIAFWAFQGWESMSFGLEEFKDPEKTIPRIYWISFLLIAALYALFALTVSLLAAKGLQISGPSGLVAMLAGYGPLRIVVLMLVVGVLVTNANAWVFGCSRIFFAAARKGLLPPAMARLNGANVPANTLWILMAVYGLTIGFIEFSDVDIHQLFMLTTQGFILLYGAAIAAYWKVEQGTSRLLVCTAACGAMIILISGFKWMMLVPAAIFIAGYLKHGRQLKGLFAA